MQTTTVLILLLASLASAQSKDNDWSAVRQLEKKDPVEVFLRDGSVVRGRLEKWATHAIQLSGSKGVEHLARQDVATVRITRHASRKKGAMWGAIVGFGIAFPIGFASAGYLTDRNSPPSSTRAGMGAGFGLLTAGIGAGLGLLSGGSRTQTIYRTR